MNYNEVLSKIAKLEQIECRFGEEKCFPYINDMKTNLIGLAVYIKEFPLLQNTQVEAENNDDTMIFHSISEIENDLVLSVKLRQQMISLPKISVFDILDTLRVAKAASSTLFATTQSFFWKAAEKPDANRRKTSYKDVSVYDFNLLLRYFQLNIDTHYLNLIEKKGPRVAISRSYSRLNTSPEGYREEVMYYLKNWNEDAAHKYKEILITELISLA